MLGTPSRSTSGKHLRESAFFPVFTGLQSHARSAALTYSAGLGPASDVIFVEGLDSCLIIPLHAAMPCFWGNYGAEKESTHEARSQDVDPDARTSGHIRRSRRSAGSRLGRRPDPYVPTTTTTLARQRQMQRQSTTADVN